MIMPSNKLAPNLIQKPAGFILTPTPFNTYNAESSTLFKYSSIEPITDSTQPSSNGEIKLASATNLVKDVDPTKLTKM